MFGGSLTTGLFQATVKGPPPQRSRESIPETTAPLHIWEVPATDVCCWLLKPTGLFQKPSTLFKPNVSSFAGKHKGGWGATINYLPLSSAIPTRDHPWWELHTVPLVHYCKHESSQLPEVCLKRLINPNCTRQIPPVPLSVVERSHTDHLRVFVGVWL